MNFRSRKLFTASLRRAIRWEFWPMTLFYIPIFFYIVWLTVRFRGLAFLSCNPGFLMSGLVGEAKSGALTPLQKSDLANDYVAKSDLISVDQSSQKRIQQAQQFMSDNELDFPIILKPNYGQRGSGVAVICSEQAIHDYLNDAQEDIIVQQHIAGEEFGVFYMRYPKANSADENDEQQSFIYSITEKKFPILIGDGQSTLERLILQNKRTHYMARFLLNLHADKLSTVLAKDQEFQTVEIGSHCRGSLFLDGNHLITPELTQRISQISEQIEGFYFGRYDIRAQSQQALQQGRDFKILEVNGVTSESTNIYDPKHSIFYAYKVLFKQWRSAFEIGKHNIQLGAQRHSLWQMLMYLKRVAAK